MNLHTKQKEAQHTQRKNLWSRGGGWGEDGKEQLGSLGWARTHCYTENG